MKGKLLLLTVLVFLFGIFVFVKFFILDAQNIYGRLKVISSPTASIFIDNIAAGKTPFEDKYKAGEYIVKLIPEGTATDTASWQGKIKIYKNSITYVNRELGSSDLSSAGEIFTSTKMTNPPSNSQFGGASVESDPSGAIVYLDNDEKGVTSLTMTDIMKGDHELSIYNPGFFRRTQKINIDPGYQVNASFKLALDKTQSQSASASSGLSSTPTVSTSSASKSTTVVIKDTPTGWLRVRQDATINATESARVNPGEKYPLLDEKEGWYKISYEKDKSGWISSAYAEKLAQ